MRHFKKVITHYITTALSYAGACADDARGDLNSAMQEVIQLEERVAALEAELQAIRAHQQELDDLQQLSSEEGL